MLKVKFLRITFAVLLLIILAIIGYNAIMKYLYPQKYSDYVEQYSTEFKVDKNLVYAVIKCESNFKSDAVSSANANGLMQLTERTFVWAQQLCDGQVNEKLDIYDPQTNIKYGTFLLSYYDKLYNGNVNMILSAYNAGVGMVEQWDDGDFTLEDIKYSETRTYVKKIQDVKKIYENLYQ